MNLLRILFPLLILITLSIPCHAHLNSISYSTIEVATDEIRIELRFTLICTLELFSVDVDGDGILTKEELQPAKPAMYYYLTNKIKILSGGRQLRMILRDLTFKVEEDDAYTIFELAYPKTNESDEFILLCNVLEETDPYHKNLAEIKYSGNDYLFVFTNINYFNSKTASTEETKPANMPGSATSTLQPSGDEK